MILYYSVMTPSTFSHIIGHGRILSYLERLLESKKLSHAYLFEGTAGLGKRTVAEIFSSAILEVASDERLLLHPDFIFVELGVNEKTGKLKKNIGIDEIRELVRRLSLTPFRSKAKVALIADAENLSAEAANALLKTLEEPSGNTHIILTVSDREMLPKTIVSRAQAMRFLPVAHEEIEKALLARGAGAEEAHAIARASFGRPALALSFVGNSGFSDYKKQLKESANVFSLSVFEKIKFIEREIPERGGEQKEKASDLLDKWETVLRGMLVTSLGASEAALGVFADSAAGASGLFGAGSILAGLEGIREARASIYENISPRFVLENFVLNI